MGDVRIGVKKLVAEAQLPRYSHVGEYGDLAADLYASTSVLLEPGATMPATALVKDFLGRPQSIDALKTWMMVEFTSAPSGEKAGGR